MKQNKDIAQTIAEKIREMLFSVKIQMGTSFQARPRLQANYVNLKRRREDEEDTCADFGYNGVACFLR